MYISKKLRSKFLKLYHAEPESGYIDKKKIRERLITRYYFPKLKREVTNFIRKCDLCYRIKYKKYRSYEMLSSSRISSIF